MTLTPSWEILNRFLEQPEERDVKLLLRTDWRIMLFEGAELLKVNLVSP